MRKEVEFCDHIILFPKFAMFRIEINFSCMKRIMGEKIKAIRLDYVTQEIVLMV